MNVFDILALVAAFGVTGWFIRLVTAKDRDKERFEEDDARTFFEQHGHWPDESRAEAEARARRAAEMERLARAEDRD